MPTEDRDELLQAELRFISTLKESLAHDAASAHHDYAADPLAKLSERAMQYELRVRDTLSSGILPDSDAGPAWGSITCSTSQSSENLSLLKIEGPGPLDSCEVEASSSTEAMQVKAYIATLSKICQAMAESENLLREALKKQADLEKETRDIGQSQSPEEIVEEHVRLLQQYNEVKDVGQQLIGMIADNRGVPVASLYETEEYGLTADD